MILFNENDTFMKWYFLKISFIPKDEKVSINRK